LSTSRLKQIKALSIIRVLRKKNRGRMAGTTLSSREAIKPVLKGCIGEQPKNRKVGRGADQNRQSKKR